MTSGARSGALLAIVGLLSGPITLAGQGNADCANRSSGPFGGMQAKNVCNAAVDGVAVFVPVAGVLVTAGNPFLGATGLGGFPHAGITLRINATQVVIPDVDYDGVGTTVAAGQTVLVPAPLIEGAIGIFRGLANGSLAVDLLGSAQLVPTGLIDNVYIDVEARHIGSVAIGLGIGGRVTLIGERGGIPAVTFSVMRRGLPRIGVGNIVAGDRYSFASDLTSTEYRVAVAKQFSALSLTAGAGSTQYRADATVVFLDPVTSVPEPPLAATIRDRRTVGFVDAGLALGRWNFIAEAGMQAGKDLALATTFTGNDPKDQRLFGSFGIRFGF